MPQMHLAQLSVAAVAAFVASSVYYIVFAKERARLSEAAAAGGGRPGPAKVLSELLRNIVLAFVIMVLVEKAGISGASSGLLLAGLLWLGFPAVLLSGSVIWERVPVKLALIHAGDWLVKLSLITLILAIWR